MQIFKLQNSDFQKCSVLNHYQDYLYCSDFNWEQTSHFTKRTHVDILGPSSCEVADCSKTKHPCSVPLLKTQKQQQQKDCPFWAAVETRQTKSNPSPSQRNPQFSSINFNKSSTDSFRQRDGRGTSNFSFHVTIRSHLTNKKAINTCKCLQIVT